MEFSTHRFDLSSQPKNSIIKVIGVGGGGSNAVNNMYRQGIQDVAFVVCNTDEQALKNSPVPNKLQIGINLTSGLGAGANPDVGKNAAIESKAEIEALLDDGTKMLFVTAGMGGGTGTGAAPVIASIAKKLDILTVGIVTIPFAFEGKKKLLKAQTGIHELRQHCDTVLIILNDKLRQILGNLSFGNAFAEADNVLTTAAKSIAEIITVPGYINVDFQDVKTVLKKAGAAVMGSAQAEGEGRARKAAELALQSPLLDYKDIRGAKKILFSIVYRHVSEIQMDEFTTITDYIQEQVGEDAEMIFGCGPDKRLKEGIRVTVIATGFEDSTSSQAMSPTQEEAVPYEIAQQKNTPTMYHNSQKANLYNTLDNRQPTSMQNKSVHNHQELKKHNLVNKDMRKSSQNNRRIAGTLSLPFDIVEAKRNLLREKAQQRMQDLTHQQAHGLSEDILKEYIEVPAYLRKGIQLEVINMIPEKDLIRYYLNEEIEQEQDV